ncbi:MAG: hypothetical protein K2Z80_25640 [Xanthobacteraceae bacterium]|nr:hypothetical protein [Xanthobacteraceae bacterium]
MLRRRLFVLSVLAAISADPAAADLLGLPAGRPAFSASEQVVIRRNRVLQSIVADNPWLVRRALDVLSEIDAGNHATSRSADPPMHRSDSTSPSRLGDDFDRQRNPDLDSASRASPEAMHDLFQLIKQAGSTKPKGAPRAVDSRAAR